MKQKRQKRFHSNRPKAEKAACINTRNCADWLRKNLSNPSHNTPTPEEQKMLEERVANGDQQAREEIFNRSLWYVFKIAGKKESVLYRFTGGTDGGQPVAALIADRNGNLYGTTKLGGTSNNGVVFEITP